MILSSLPRSYDGLVTALEARSEADLTIFLIKSKLIDEYNRRKEINSSSNSGNCSILKTTESKLFCFFCKKNGHVKKNCRKYKSWKKKEGKRKQDKNTDKRMISNKVNKVENNKFLFIISSHNSNDWIIDFGATNHVTSDKGYFVSLEHMDSSSLNIANGEKVYVQGKGTCKIQEFINSDGVTSYATVTDVLYALQINGNLLLVKKLIDKGFTVNFLSNFCEIKRGNKQIGIAKANGNLYKLCQSDKVYDIKEYKSNCIHYCHRVFRHQDPNTIKEMCSKQIVDEIKICDCEIKIHCEVFSRQK